MSLKTGRKKLLVCLTRLIESLAGASAYRCHQVVSLWTELGITPQTQLETQIANGIDQFPLSPDNIKAVKGLAEKLVDTKQSRLVELQDAVAEILRLWDVLERLDEQRYVDGVDIENPSLQSAEKVCAFVF